MKEWDRFEMFRKIQIIRKREREREKKEKTKEEMGEIEKSFDMERMQIWWRTT